MNNQLSKIILKKTPKHGDEKLKCGVKPFILLYKSLMFIPIEGRGIAAT